MSGATAVEVGRLWTQLKRIADALTATQKDVFVRLPGLEEYWPCGIRTGLGRLAEHGGGGSNVTMVGTVPTGFDGNAYAHLGNGINYFAQVGVAGITGAETYIDTSIRGLTVGGWFMVDTSPASVSDGLVSRDAPAPQRGYVLGVGTTDVPFFYVSGTGAAAVTAVGPAMSLGAWHFIVGRFTPGTEVAVFIDGDKTVVTTAVPATQFVSSASFEIGRYEANDSRIIHAKARDVFVCAAALSDDLIEIVRQATLP